MIMNTLPGERVERDRSQEYGNVLEAWAHYKGRKLRGYSIRTATRTQWVEGPIVRQGAHLAQAHLRPGERLQAIDPRDMPKGLPVTRGWYATYIGDDGEEYIAAEIFATTDGRIVRLG